MYCLAFTKSLFSALVLLVLIASSVCAAEPYEAVGGSCIVTASHAEHSAISCQSAALDDGSVSVPSLLQKVGSPVQGIARVQVPALQDDFDEGEPEVPIVPPKHGQRAMEPGEAGVSGTQQKVNLMDSKSSKARTSSPTKTSFHAEPASSLSETSSHPNSNHENAASSLNEAQPHNDLKRTSDASAGAAIHDSSASINHKTGGSTDHAIDFLQESSVLQQEKTALVENITMELQSQAAKVESGSDAEHAHAVHHKHHKHHLFPPNSTSRHQIALAVRHLLEGYLQSAKRHPLLSPLLSRHTEPKRLEHGVAEHGSTPGSTKLEQPLPGEDGAMNDFYFGCILLCSCLIVWMFCLACWPTAGEHVDAALGIGPAVLVGKQAPDFTMTMLDGSCRRLRDITQEGKPVVVKFYNQDDAHKVALRSSRFSHDAKGLELMARDVKYAGHVNFVLVNLQGQGAAVEYHNGLKLSGALQSTFSGAAILHGGLNGAWCDLSQDYHTNYCPHTTIIDSQGIVVRNYNHVKWWTEGNVVGEDFAALSQTVDDLLKALCNDEVSVVME